MRHQLKIAMFFLFIFPCCAFSLNVNDYFYQSLEIDNEYYPQAILVTDAVEPALQNKSVAKQGKFSVDFPHDQFTNASGQTFTHTIDVRSAVDNTLICTVTTSLVIDSNGEMTFSEPISSDSSKCHAWAHMSFWFSDDHVYYRISVADNWTAAYWLEVMRTPRPE